MPLNLESLSSHPTTANCKFNDDGWIYLLCLQSHNCNGSHFKLAMLAFDELSGSN